MKKFFILMVACIATITLMSSCAKDNTVIPADAFDQKAEQPVDIFSIDLEFDAPADLEATTIEFYDEYGQGVATLTVPVIEGEKEVVFTSESRPTALYTEGLQNVNADGVLPIPEQSVATKAGRQPVLLVIR